MLVYIVGFGAFAIEIPELFVADPFQIGGFAIFRIPICENQPSEVIGVFHKKGCNYLMQVDKGVFSILFGGISDTRKVTIDSC